LIAFLSRLIIFILITSFSIGCSTTKKDKKHASFDTRISESGLKHFELRLGGVHAKNGNSQRTRQSNQNNRPPTSYARQHKKNQKRLEKVAHALIADNQYCREDFWVLDFDIDTRGYFLRGECNDLATSEDRIRFKDSIKNW